VSAGPENRYIADVHRLLPPVDLFYRMKNHNVYNGGIADCWYSASTDLWIEWKFHDLAKRGSTMIDLVSGKNPSISALQQDWIKCRVAEGRSVWVAVGTALGTVVYQDTSWDQPIRTDHFIARLISKKATAKLILQACKGSP